MPVRSSVLVPFFVSPAVPERTPPKVATSSASVVLTVTSRVVPPSAMLPSRVRSFVPPTAKLPVTDTALASVRAAAFACNSPPPIVNVPVPIGPFVGVASLLAFKESTPALSVTPPVNVLSSLSSCNVPSPVFVIDPSLSPVSEIFPRRRRVAEAPDTVMDRAAFPRLVAPSRLMALLPCAVKSPAIARTSSNVRTPLPDSIAPPSIVNVPVPIALLSRKSSVPTDKVVPSVKVFAPLSVSSPPPDLVRARFFSSAVDPPITPLNVVSPG